MLLKEMSLKNLKSWRKLNKKVTKNITASYFLHYEELLYLFTILERPALPDVILPFQALTAPQSINHQLGRMHIVHLHFFLPFLSF